MSRSAGMRALLLAVALASCVAVAPPAPPALPTPTASASASATAAPTPHPFLAILQARDRAQAAGDVAAAMALVDPQAPAAFVARERALAEAGGKRRSAPPRRELTWTLVTEALATFVVTEADDQGRERAVRYFVTRSPSQLLTEPGAAFFGDERTSSFPGGSVRYRTVDEQQAAVLVAEAPRAVEALVARLGPEYALRTTLSFVLRPDVVAELPPFASAYVAEGTITFLSSASMLVDAGPGAAWTRTVITHEVAHALLFQRGNGTFLLNEGLPLWLTDDRRQPELDRLVAADALWTLDHLLDGPREPAEFFAGYAQASSFVRFLAQRHGDRAVIATWEAGRRLTFAEAFREATGTEATAAYAAWRASLGR